MFWQKEVEKSTEALHELHHMLLYLRILSSCHRTASRANYSHGFHCDYFLKSLAISRIPELL